MFKPQQFFKLKNPLVNECKFIGQVTKINHQDSQYLEKTTEVFRIDYSLISKLSECCFDTINEWQKQLQIKSTKHWIRDRLQQYIDKPSKNGKYIEITKKEYEWLSQVSLKKFIHTGETKLVEIGWNKYNEICKVAYVLKIPNIGTTSSSTSPTSPSSPSSSTTSTTSRFLFFCLGIDGGLKTAYITPYFKYKKKYGGTVEYKTCNDLIEKFNKIKM